MRIRHFIIRFAVTLCTLTAMHSFAEIKYVRTSVGNLLHRDTVTHVSLTGTALTGIRSAIFSCSAQGDLANPVILVSSPNYKTFRDTLMIAYALNKEVNLILETSTPCAYNSYPVIFGVDFVGAP
jgi:hypothetical protein